MIKNILVIDDSVEIQMLLKLLLTSKGYQIECSSNGKLALELLSLHESLPDLIFLDIQMPVMDGLSFLQVREKDERLRDVPVILMSGDEDIHRTGAIANVMALLKKPLSMTSVLETVEESNMAIYSKARSSSLRELRMNY